jgi:hypothetical protein
MTSDNPDRIFHWKDFGSNVVTSLQEMRDDCDFFDVTIMCEDCTFVQV